MEGESVVDQSNDEDEVRIGKLLAWAKSHSVWIHDDALIGKMAGPSSEEEVASSNTEAEREQSIEGSEGEEEDAAYPDREKRAKGAGFSVFVKPGGKILERQVITLVPKSSLLSVRTSSLAPHLPTAMLFSSDATSGMLLALVLLHEQLLGKDGPWWGYLQSLPRENEHWGIQLPYFLSRDSETWKLMAHSEAGRMVKRAEADPMGRIEGLGMSLPRLRHFFKSKGLSILRKAQPTLFDGRGKDFEQLLLGDYIRAHSIVSSRTFIVDMYHGMCLAPIADMYNHSADASIHFEADDEVCDECGSLGACPHNDDPLPSEAYGRPSSILPAKSGPNSQDWIPPIELRGVDTVDMVAQQDLGAEEEAYNTYGNFSNANLLTTYGFCLEYETEWERYVWEWRNKEEKEEILYAMGIQAITRRKADDELPDGNQISRWVEACVAFTGLPENSFAEILSDSYPLPQTKLTDPSTTINVPIFSPFVALTGSATEEQVDTDLEASLEEVITPLSSHDGSKDTYQPLFVDHQGKISLSLWRAVLLYSISEQAPIMKAMGHDSIETAKRVRDCVHATEVLFSKAVDAKVETPSQRSNHHEGSSVLRQSLGMLLKLVSSRLGAIESIADDKSAHALSVLEKYQPGLLRDAALQSFQEMTALSTCIKWLSRCINAISDGETP